MKTKMWKPDQDRIDHIFRYMEYDVLTENEDQWVSKYYQQWEEKRWLSERQVEVLEDIFEAAAERDPYPGYGEH